MLKDCIVYKIVSLAHGEIIILEFVKTHVQMVNLLIIYHGYAWTTVHPLFMEGTFLIPVRIIVLQVHGDIMTLDYAINSHDQKTKNFIIIIFIIPIKFILFLC